MGWLCRYEVFDVRREFFFPWGVGMLLFIELAMEVRCGSADGTYDVGFLRRRNMVRRTEAYFLESASKKHHENTTPLKINYGLVLFFCRFFFAIPSRLSYDEHSPFDLWRIFCGSSIVRFQQLSIMY